MIGVLGGTGTTGSPVVAALKAKGADFKCIVRDPEAAAAKLGADVELVQGDMSDQASLEAAFAGIDTLYLLCGHSPMLGDMETNALNAAKVAGVSRIVQSSGSEKGITADSPSEIMRTHFHMENKIKESGLKWAISRPNFFISNLLAMAEPIAGMGKLITALPPETEISMIHPADIGESVAELLTNEDYDGAAYFLTGPVVTMEDVRAAISRAVGREIEYMQVPPEAASKAMADKGMPDWLIAHMGGMMGLTARGGMNGSTDWVEKLTGHPPRTIDDWIGENKAAFGG